MRFKVGDVVVICSILPEMAAVNGTEVTILEALPNYLWHGPCYRVDASFHVRNYGPDLFKESALRPKRPPSIELGSWSEIERTVGWSPTREIA